MSDEITNGDRPFPCGTCGERTFTPEVDDRIHAVLHASSSCLVIFSVIRAIADRNAGQLSCDSSTLHD